MTGHRQVLGDGKAVSARGGDRNRLGARSRRPYQLSVQPSVRGTSFRVLVRSTTKSTRRTNRVMTAATDRRRQPRSLPSLRPVRPRPFAFGHRRLHRTGTSHPRAPTLRQTGRIADLDRRRSRTVGRQSEKDPDGESAGRRRCQWRERPGLLVPTRVLGYVRLPFFYSASSDLPLQRR